MRFLVLLVAFAAVVSAANVAIDPEHVRRVQAVLRVASGRVFNEPELAEAIEAIRSDATNIANTAVTSAAACVVSARNATLFNDQCSSLLVSLAGNAQNLLPGAATVNITQSSVDTVCRSPCFQRFVNFINSWTQCLAALPPVPTPAASGMGFSTDGNSFTMSSFSSGVMSGAVQSLSIIAQMYCLRNENGQYCMPIVQNAVNTLAGAETSAITTSITAGTATSSSTDAAVANILCPFVTTTGCCLGAFLSSLGGMMTAMSPGSQAAFQQSMNATQQQVMQYCHVMMAMSCTPTNVTAARLNGAVRLSLLWSWWTAQTPATQALVKNALCTDLASAGGFYASACTVTGVTSGSSRRLLQSSANTAFNYQVLGVSTAALQAASPSLTGNMNFTDVSLATGQPVTGTSSVSTIAAATPAPASAGVILSANACVLLLLALLASLLF